MRLFIFMLGDWPESRCLREKARVELALAQLQPALNIQEAAGCCSRMEG